MAAAGAAVDDLVAIAGAEGWGGPLAAQVESVRRAGAPLTVSDLAVSGEDLLAAGVPRGPMMGEVLRALLDEVLEDPARNTSAYLASRIPLHVSHFTLPQGRGEGSAEP
jgi:hypothetical protein